MNTPPSRVVESESVAILSQLRHKDVLLAILAIKSFMKKVPVGALYILNDGSLTEEDQAVLERNFPDIKFLDVASFQSDACPKGGTWERLLAIAALSRDHFVIQLDSDTLTVDDLPEISDCVIENTSFVIGTWDSQSIESMAFRQSEAARVTSGQVGSYHVQLMAELSFSKLTNFQQLNYVRGCSGFTGFAKGSVSREFIENISSEMFKILGDRWCEWGTEQVMSNIVVANASDVVVLPHPKYSDCTKAKVNETVFIHFIGTCRFSGDLYHKLSREVMKLF
jgi:hypothetical protein